QPARGVDMGKAGDGDVFEQHGKAAVGENPCTLPGSPPGLNSATVWFGGSVNAVSVLDREGFGLALGLAGRLRGRRTRPGGAAAEGQEALFAVGGLGLGLDGIGAQARGLVA